MVHPQFCTLITMLSTHIYMHFTPEALPHMCPPSHPYGSAQLVSRYGAPCSAQVLKLVQVGVPLGADLRDLAQLLTLGIL